MQYICTVETEGETLEDVARSLEACVESIREGFLEREEYYGQAHYIVALFGGEEETGHFLHVDSPSGFDSYPYGSFDEVREAARFFEGEAIDEGEAGLRTYYYSPHESEREADVKIDL